MKIGRLVEHGTDLLGFATAIGGAASAWSTFPRVMADFPHHLLANYTATYNLPVSIVLSTSFHESVLVTVIGLEILAREYVADGARLFFRKRSSRRKTA